MTETNKTLMHWLLPTHFEIEVYRLLRQAFDDVKPQHPLQGYGKSWIANFFVSDVNSVIEATTTGPRGLENKIREILVKFGDLSRNHADYKFVFLMDQLGRGSGRHKTTVSPLLSLMTKYRYVFLTRDELGSLDGILRGIIDPAPIMERLRGRLIIRYDLLGARVIRAKILEILSLEPMLARDVQARLVDQGLNVNYPSPFHWHLRVLRRSGAILNIGTVWGRSKSQILESSIRKPKLDALRYHLLMDQLKKLLTKPLTMNEICAALKVEEQKISYAMGRMRKEGILTREGTHLNYRWYYTG